MSSASVVVVVVAVLNVVRPVCWKRNKHWVSFNSAQAAIAGAIVPLDMMDHVNRQSAD